MAETKKRIVTIKCGIESAQISSNYDSLINYFINYIRRHDFSYEEESPDLFEFDNMGDYLSCVREASNMGLLI